MTDRKDLKLADADEFLAPYRPTPARERAKVRLEAKLRELGGSRDLESLTEDELVEYAGDRRILTWLRDQEFARWLAERDSFMTSALAARQEIIDMLIGIVRSDYEPKILTAKDKSKAAEILLNVTASFPAKQKEVRFLDRDLDNMPDDQVKSETAKLQAMLKQKALDK